jgi:hypothetical protein
MPSSNGRTGPDEHAERAVDLADHLAGLCERWNDEDRTPIIFHKVLRPTRMERSRAVLLTKAVAELLQDGLSKRDGGRRVGIELWTNDCWAGSATLLIADDGEETHFEPCTPSVVEARRFIECAGAKLDFDKGRGVVWRIAINVWPTPEAWLEGI